MGKAAALTGGYGNSYAQTVGQQAYNSYLQQLNSVVPELYQLAYDRYLEETDALEKKYALLREDREAAYSQYQDALSRHMVEKENAYKLYQDALSRQDKAYTRLYQLILAGHTPTDAELKNAGMTRAMANVIAG